MTKQTDKYDHALLYASAVHGGQMRKGTTIPYLSHLIVAKRRSSNGGVQ